MAWSVEFTDKNGDKKYRFYEKYKDPRTKKDKRVSVVLDGNSDNDKETATKELNEKIKNVISNIDFSEVDLTNDIKVIERRFITSYGIDKENFDEYKFIYLNPYTGSIESDIVYVFEGMKADDVFFINQIKSNIEESYKKEFRLKYNSIKILSELNDLEFYEVIQIQDLINSEKKSFNSGRIANELKRMNDIKESPEIIDGKGEILSALNIAFNKMSLALTGVDFKGRNLIHPNELMAISGVKDKQVNHEALKMLTEFGLIRKDSSDNGDMVRINFPSRQYAESDST